MMQEQAKLWQTDDFDNLELLRATYITHAFDKHYHDSFGIGIIEKGALFYYNNGTQYAFQKGDVLVINPRDVHFGHAAQDGGWTYRMFYPSADFMRQIAADINENTIDVPYFANPIIHDKSLAALLVKAHATIEASNENLERETNFRMAISQLVMQYAMNQPEPAQIYNNRRIIQSICEYMADHYTDNIALDELADLAGFSRFHLLRLFRDQVGLPPHKYLTNLRIQRAKNLLAKGCPIKQVAADTGFTDQSHLTRRFKSIVGVTPGQYATQIQA